MNISIDFLSFTYSTLYGPVFFQNFQISSYAYIQMKQFNRERHSDHNSSQLWEIFATK